jgi:hypothetical protein
MGDTNPKTVTLTHGELWAIIALTGIAVACVAVAVTVGAATTWSMVSTAIAFFSGGCIGQIVRHARLRTAPGHVHEPDPHTG